MHCPHPPHPPPPTPPAVPPRDRTENQHITRAGGSGFGVEGLRLKQQNAVQYLRAPFATLNAKCPCHYASHQVVNASHQVFNKNSQASISTACLPPGKLNGLQRLQALQLATTREVSCESLWACLQNKSVRQPAHVFSPRWAPERLRVQDACSEFP